MHLSLLTNTNNSSLGEVLPIFLMFSSDAQQEENFRIRCDWVVGLPKVTAKFGHREEQQFCAQIVVNEKVGQMQGC